MSEQQLKAFLEAVKADAGLREKLNAATNPEAIVAIAKEAGFSISSTEYANTQAEVTDEELEGVSGGTWTPQGRYLRENPPLLDR